MPNVSQPFRLRASERAFSLIEVIIAMTIVAVVLSGAAAAVVSSDNAEGRTKAVADSHAIAEKAIERLRTDLTAQSGCDANGWIQAATAAKNSNSGSETNFLPCKIVPAYQIKDSKGRNYIAQPVVEAKDKPDDGLGVNDTDGDLRDAYDVEVSVTLEQGSKAGREDTKELKLGGAVDWKGGTADDGRVRVIACAIDRPDRSLIAGGCASGDASRQPITISVGAARVSSETGTSANAGSITSGSTPVGLRPGAYRFTAPASINSGGANFKLLKLDPANLSIAGSQDYTIQATYVRDSMTTRVCTQINNWTGPYDDGYEVRATNLHYRRANQPGYRSTQLTLNNDRSWNCTAAGHVLTDPVEDTPTSLYRGLYDLEVEQVKRRVPAHIWGLQVSDAKLNCSLNAWNQPIGGTNLISRSADTTNERPGSGPSVARESWFARLAINAGAGGQTVCLRFTSKQFERERCWPPNERAPGCFYIGQECLLPPGTVDNDSNCWNGAEVCTANCGNGGGAPAGSAVGGASQYNAGGVSGGPNDPTVACTTDASGYQWPGSRFPAIAMYANANKPTFLSRTWVGGDAFYYGSFSGRVAAFKGHPFGTAPEAWAYNLPDNPIYRCNSVYFTGGANLIKTRYPFYTCLEVRVPGRPYAVRGRMLDISGNGNTLFGTVAGAIGLAPDAPALVNHWNPFNDYSAVTGGGNWPVYSVRVVQNDPTCDSGSGPVFTHVDPIIREIWHRVVDDPFIAPLAPPLTTTNLGTDKIGV